MNHKKLHRISALLLVSLLAIGLCLGAAGCSNKQKLYIFNWGDYIAPEAIEKFKKAYPQYEVVYDTFDTNETMYQKLVSTNIPYDVLIPSDYMIARLIEEDRLMEIDTSKLENYGKIRNSLKAQAFDPEDKYSVPYIWGTLGIVYNKTLVNGPVDSWDVLWDEQYKDQILMLDSVRDSMCAALIKLGYSLNSTNPDEIAAAGKLLEEQKKLVKQYGVDDIKEPMINGHYALCLHWSGDALWMMQQNKDLEYVVPKEGSNIWIDSMVIPKASKNYEGAMAFIDFMCSTEIAKLNTEYIEYSTPQEEVLSLLDKEHTENHVYNPSDSEIENTKAFDHLGDAVELYNKAWENLRLSTAIGEENERNSLAWVYALIAVVVVAAVVVLIILKKKKDKLKYED